MMAVRTITLSLGFAVFLALPAHSQVEQRPQKDSTRPATLRIDRAVSPAADAERLADVTANPDLLRRRLQISDSALLAGRITAVRDRTAVPVSTDNLAEALKPGTVLVDRARTSVTPQAVPRELRDAQAPDARTYKLGFDVLTPEGPLEAWGRDITGLRMDGELRGFHGSFDVALARRGARSGNAAMQPAVAVSVQAKNATRIEPRHVEVDRLGRWYPVNIQVARVDGQRYAVNISAFPEDPGDRIELPIQRPVVRLTVNPSDPIPGWGIGTARVSVEVRDIDNPQGYGLTLQSSSGTLEPVSVRLDAEGYGETTLRSSRSSGATISVARSGVFASEQVRVRFETPWIYLSLAMLGGLVGAFLRKPGRAHWLKAAGVGALTGVLMALLVAVGINWIGGVFPDANLATGGEAVVFVLGALGALAGVGVLLPRAADA